MLRSVLLFFAGVLCAFFSEAQITSTFDTDADGWAFFNGTFGSLTPGSFNVTGGNPGGYISMTYGSNVGITTQSWIAPAKFLGNQAVRSLGMNLQFNLQQSAAGTNSNGSGDVRIESTGVILVYSLPVKPALFPAWSSYSIKLDETGGWRISSTTGALATRTQIIQALSAITAIEIRGTYITNASYTSGLDNVVLEQKALAAVPTIASFAPLKGNAGTVLTISGSNFDPIPANNSVYFGSVQASITSSSISQIVVTIPVSAAYGPIQVVNKTLGTSVQSVIPFNPTFPDGGRIILSSFDPKADILLDPAPGNDLRGLSVADLDNDGWPDLAFAENVLNSISVYRNLGVGGDVSVSSFAPKLALAAAGNGGGMRILDIDNDGKLDIICGYAGPSVVNFATYRNTSTPGNLSFEAVELWAGPVYSGSLSDALDVDGDGRIDLVGQHGNGSVNPDFWIAQNISSPGNIEFANSVTYFGSATLDAGAGVSSGDLNNDGKPDFIVEHSFAGQFQIIQNNSTPGTISLGTPFPIAQSVNGNVQVVDLNLDGKKDLAWKQGAANDVRIRINTNAGGTLAASDFATEVILLSDLSNYGGIEIGDFNGDGKPDLLASDPTNIGVFENVYTSGPFTANAFAAPFIVQGSGISTYPYAPIACDLNGDSKPELIVGVTNTSPNRISLYENKNIHSPVISLTTVSPLKGPVGSTVTITGDYFSTNPLENIVTFGGVRAEVNSATRNLLTVTVPAGAAYGPVSVTRDELTSRYHLPFDVVFSPGRTFSAASFSAPVNFTLTTADFDIDAADLNGDNKIDIVAEGAALATYSFRNVHTSGPITVSSLVPDDTTSSNAQNPKLIDLDGDSKPDIVSANGIYRNTSVGSEISFQSNVPIGSTTNVGIADLNLDGRIDFTGVNGSINMFENQTRPGPFISGGYPSVSAAFFISVGGTAVGTAVADFDNDGYSDIAATVNSSIDYITFSRNTGGYRITNTQFVTGQSINTLDLPGRVYEGDFDVDGKVDFMIYHQAGGTNGNMFSVFHNQSTGPGNVTFVQHDFTIGATPGAAGTVGGPGAIADLDGDGKPEIIITSGSSTVALQGFYIFKNNTTPGTINATSFANSGLTQLAGARAVAAADINFDSKPDLIFTRTGNLMSILENLLVGVPVTIDTQPGSNSICSGGTIVLGVTASGDPSLQYQWQQLVGATFTNISNNTTYSGATTPTLTISNLPATTTYRVLVTGSFASAASSNATVTVNTIPSPPATTSNGGCSGFALSLGASGGTNGQYRWYTTLTGGAAIAGQFNDIFNTPVLTSTTSYFVAISNGFCESTRTEAIATITTVPAPATTPASRCNAGTLILSASGGSNGDYRWYDVASGGTPISGAVNASFTTPSLSTTTTYHISLSNGTCESSRTSVAATINTPPSKPSITSSVTPAAGIVAICSGAVTLSAPAGFTYAWSNGATTQQIVVSALGTFTVQITDGNSCTSVASDALQVIVDPTTCNTAPVMVPEQLTTAISGNVSLTLSEIVTDAENNLDNVIIVSQPISGATATIVNGVLTIDYSKTSFSGTDRIIVRACDVQNLCSEDVTITIEVVGEIEVFNAVSPNGDGLNEFLRFQYIEVLERTRKNKVTILNRWGDNVFEITDYDNNTRVFRGTNTSGVELPSGTYFYKIEFTGPNAPAMKTGYFALKR